MAELIHEFRDPLIDAGGTVYLVRVYGEPQASTWQGWIEFVPEKGGQVLRTTRETTQSNRTGLTYWATGLEPIYLEGALQRARSAA